MLVCVFCFSLCQKCVESLTLNVNDFLSGVSVLFQTDRVGPQSHLSVSSAVKMGGITKKPA